MPHPLPYVIIANWKMNGSLGESIRYIKELREDINTTLIGCEIAICPPATLLRDMAEKTSASEIKLGGQDCHHEENGAYTGEISAKMLHEMTCDYVILGHSERRTHNNENNEIVRKKAKTAHKAKLQTIICVGETSKERDSGKHLEVVAKQVEESIPDCSNFENTIIAYEPVWAIGSGKTPSKEEIFEMHQHIIKTVNFRLKTEKSQIRVVYGGSVNADNSKNILAIRGVKGLLVGRASLDAEEFFEIIRDAS